MDKFGFIIFTFQGSLKGNASASQRISEILEAKQARRHRLDRHVPVDSFH